MAKPHYENHDALLQAAIGGIAVIIFNVLSHFNLIHLLFGFGTDPIFVVQTITVFIMVILTWFLTRYSRVENPPPPMPPPTLPPSNSELPPYDKQQSQSQSWQSRFLSSLHFHYPILLKPLVHYPVQKDEEWRQKS